MFIDIVPQKLFTERPKMKYILIVEDEPDILETIVGSLQDEFGDKEIHFEKAVNGEEALNIIRETNNHYLIVTDINMPVMDGFQFVKNLRGLNFDFPVVVFSAHADQEEQYLNDLGVTAMIKKPYLKDLISAVTKIVVD